MRSAVIVLLALVAIGAQAGEMLIKVVRPLHRPAAELLGVVKPLVPPPGSVSAFRGTLVIRSDPDTLGAIESMLATVDRPARDLIVSVRHGYAQGTRHRHVYSTRSGRDERDHQRLRVGEGRTALIRTGEDVPVASRGIVLGPGGARVEESVDYRSADTGFLVRANLLGNGHVALDVWAERTRPADGGAFDTSAASTRITVPLGRWVELGGNLEETERGDAGVSYRTYSDTRSNRQIFIRVDRAP